MVFLAVHRTWIAASLPLPASASLPIHVRPSLTVRKNRGKFELNVQPPRGITAPVENLIMLATLPASAQDVKVETTAGKAVWDVLGKVIELDISRIDRSDDAQTAVTVVFGQAF